MSWPAFEFASTSIFVPVEVFSYVALVTSTPAVVDFLPTRTKLFVWMQSSTGPV